MAKTIAVLLAALALSAPARAPALKVRADRPRILFAGEGGRGTSLAVYRERCKVDPAYRSRCQSSLSSSGGGLYPAAARAAAYLVNGDPARCSEAFSLAQSVAADAPGSPDAHSFISNNGRAMLQLAAVRDWCAPALSPTQLTWLEDRIVSRADWYLANPPPDVFHDDMNNVWSSVALAGLALAGGAQDAKAQTYLAAADKQFKQVILPALAYAGDFWHEGFVYVQPALGRLAWYAVAWTAATDDDVFAWARQNANDLFEGYLAFHAYLLRPDYKFAYFGDTTDAKQSMELFSRWLVDAFTLGTGSRMGQGLSMEIRDNSRPGYDYSNSDAWLLALLYDATKEAQAIPRSALPTARRLGEGAADVAVMRSGWGPNDAFVTFSCGDYLGPHQRYESGSFQLFRRSILSGPDGYYDAFDTDHWQNYYSQHSVHSNALAIFMPGEFFPTLQSLADRSRNVNDGGQRTLRRDARGGAFPNRDLATYLAHKVGPPYVETGDMRAFEHGALHDYVACDVTAAYSSPGYTTNGNAAKVNEVSRQLVFLRPELVVLFDRVESTNASYEKRFLLHTPVAPVVNGRSFSAANGLGRLLGQTLLPAPATLRTVDNFKVEGVPHPPSTMGAESGGTRLEIVPAEPKQRDYFLHVLDAADYTRTQGPAATVQEDEAEVRVTIDDRDRAFTLSFAKTGPMAGRLSVQEKASGAVLFEGALGGSPSPGTDAGFPGPDGGSGGELDAGFDPADAGAEDPDAGEGPDASAEADAGSAGADAGAPPADAGEQAADAGLPANPGDFGEPREVPGAKEPEPCGCGSSGDPLALASAVGLVALFVRRRKA